MPTLIPEDGTGRPDANSYCSLAEADQYHDESVNGAGWAALDADTKTRALIEATRLIDAGWKWFGKRAKPDQALAWPRYGVPDPDSDEGEVQVAPWMRRGGPSYLPDNEVPADIKRATAWLALQVTQKDFRADPPGQGLSSLTLQGVVSLSFDPKSAAPLIPKALVELNRYGRPMWGVAAVKLARS
jgi:hypothetical protein